MEIANKIFDFFISHSGAETDEAEKLYEMLKQINPEWEIFFDKETLRTEVDWKQKMFYAVEHSKHLIFLAKNCETLKIGSGWVSREVDLFYDGQTTKMRYGKEHLNISYFGITYGWDLETELFSDPEHGSEYRAIYKTPNHLFLNKNDSVTNFYSTIRQKVLNMTEEAQNHLPALLFDRTYKYSATKELEDESFNKNRIIESIIPQLSSSNKYFSCEQLFSVIEEKNISIIGSEGGSGKTTLMTKAFFHFLEKACNQNPSEVLIPIYIEASTLTGSDYLIMRNIAKNLYGEITATSSSFTNSETTNIISALVKEFTRDTEKPNYLLLIDGYNEIPDNSISKFNDELKECLDHSKYKNIRIVVAGRDVDDEIFNDYFNEDNLTRYNIERIKKSTVKSFLEEKGYTKRISESLLSILSIPMYLTMYANMTTQNAINSRSDLLNSFVERQLLKDKDSATDERQAACYKFFLQYLLPFIAFRLATKEKSDTGNFVLSYNDILAITTDAREYFTSDKFKEHLGMKGRKILTLSNFENIDKYSLVDSAIIYYTKVSKLLRSEDQDNENFRFVHQVYRDFFAAVHIYNDICFAANTKHPCAAITASTNEHDITNLTAELLNEDVPTYDKTLGIYNYDCNKTSRLIKLLENSRENMQCQNADFSRGVIHLLKIIRKGNLAACDFSELDLTKSNFCFAVLSAFDSKNSYPSTFKNAKINSENLLINNPEAKIMAACTNDDVVAIFDSTGTISIWSKTIFNNTPLKIINNIPFKLHKIIFSPDGKTIYGRAGHTILEITIPEEKFGSEYKIIYQTNTRLRDIFLDESGEIYFTDVFNTYNPKPISNPDAPDSINFYGINSASTIRHDKKQIALGYISGYDGLKIYDFIDSENRWAEKKFGVNLLIEEFISKIEQILKNANVYTLFYTLDDQKNHFYYQKNENAHCDFFEGLLLSFNNEHSDYECLPDIIFKKLRSKMNTLNIPHQESILLDITKLQDEYKTLLSQLLENNRALAFMHGRKFSSIEYKPGTSILLVTYYNEYDENKRHYTHTTVAELNTETLATKIIHIYSGHAKVTATYSGDDIVITTDEKLWISTKNGNFYTFPVIYHNSPKFFYSNLFDCFYMKTNVAVYEISKDFVCTKNYFNNFGRQNYAMVIANNSTPYLVSQNALSNYQKCVLAGESDEQNGLYMYNLNLGLWEEVSEFDHIVYAKNKVTEFNGKTITSSNGNIAIYDQDVAEYDISLQRNLLVTGCDFTGISGSLTEPKYMDSLNFYGAKTDHKTEKAIATKVQLDFSYTASNIPYEETEDIQNYVSPYIFDEDDTNIYQPQNLPPAKDYRIWPKIQKGSNSRDGFEPSDFSILEWIEWLDILTPETIYYLMESGNITKPTVYKYERSRITKRLNKTLYQNLRLLTKYMNTKSLMPLYTLSDYPKAILPKVIGSTYRGHALSFDSPTSISKILLLNLWYSYSLMKMKDYVVNQRNDAFFETENSLISKEKIIRRYIQLKNGALFTRIIRGTLNDEKIAKNQKCIKYFCELASNYPYLMCNGVNEGITAAPTIVILCEDFNCCKILNDAFENICPHIRKIYTYDALMCTCIKNNSEDMYLEFRDKKAYKVSMRDLPKQDV